MSKNLGGDEIRQEAQRLWELGLAIHWLHPSSKRPIGAGWASGPRKEWPELADGYVLGMNVGVRLGTPSKIGDGYLAVIDVDVKSADPAHREAALAAVGELLGTPSNTNAAAPGVLSGRGNGSRHYYGLTAAPFKTVTPFRSDEMVKVQAPSKQRPSKRELAALTLNELENGIRLMVAWEISLYSDGRQVVLPPSVHPDTGKRYVWVSPGLTSREALPLFDFTPWLDAKVVTTASRTKAEGKRPIGRAAGDAMPDFEIDETLDIRWDPRATPTMRALVVDGLWKGQPVTDESAYLMVACQGLMSARLTRDEILSVLTDSGAVLGQCALRHAGGGSREAAARWLWKYTLERVEREKDPKAAFEGAPATGGNNEGGLIPTTGEELGVSVDLVQGLAMTNGANKIPKANFHNCQFILAQTGAKLGFDAFVTRERFLEDAAWGAVKDTEPNDHDVLRFKKYCVDKFGVEFPTGLINEAFTAHAIEHSYHPVRDRLKCLVWDGNARLDTWLTDHLGASGPERYVRAISRKVLVALVARVFNPGCKFDYVLILEGIQGTGKSTLLGNLVGTEYFTDEKIQFGDKEAVVTMQGKWLIELGELSGFNQSDAEVIKAFITRRVDRIRMPYGRRAEDYPRQCVFIGSTNAAEYLKDETGNRRFWPVACHGDIDPNSIVGVRDQLLAEAVHYYHQGETLYLDKEVEALAAEEQEAREVSDEWLEIIWRITSAPEFPRKEFSMHEITSSSLPGAMALRQVDQRRIARCLKQLGFEKYRTNEGSRRKKWRPNPDL